MKKGFTLVELLVVIGIIAVLATATVLILNPAQMLQEARDTQRLSDLNALSSAISLYLATVQGATLGNGASFNCTSHYGASVATTVSWMANRTTAAQHGVRAVDGTGWAAVKLSDIPGGSPLSVLPQDPVNTAGATGLNYQFGCSGTTQFELDAKMESAKYQAYYTSDGGNNNSAYEVGNTLAL